MQIDFNAGSKAIYLKYYGLLEKRRWSIDEDVAWQDSEQHAADAPLQEMLYIASLIESYTFTTTPNFLHRHKDLPWIMALQMARGYEECKHGNALWRYLEGLGYPVNDSQISAIQEVPDAFESMDLFARNVFSWLSEVETTVFYAKVSERLHDPVGKQLLALISQDERVHGSFLFDTLKLQLQQDPSRAQQLLGHLQTYQDPSKESHYGAAVGAETFGQVREWANQVGVDTEVGKFVEQRLQVLLQAAEAA